MTGDDLRKIFLGRTLFRLDTVLGARLVPVLYAAGLAGLLVWAVRHLFATFSRTFGDGLWGLLEIAVFGLIAILVLRLACEALLVFFKAHEAAARAVGLSRVPASLLDEVREAISEIADEEDALDDVAPATRVRRTARRTPTPPPPPSPPSTPAAAPTPPPAPAPAAPPPPAPDPAAPELPLKPTPPTPPAGS